MLTEEQRAFFEEEGYLIIPNALTPEELARARRAVGAAEARWRADPSLPGVRRPDLEQVQGIMEYDPFLAGLLEHPRVFPLVWELVGPSVMMLDHDYFITPPGAEIPFELIEPLGVEMPNSEVPEDLPGAVKMALPAGSAYMITGRTYHSAGNNRSDVVRRLLIYTYGHKWMRMWDEYRPSEALASGAETPVRRQLLGLTDPYGPPASGGETKDTKDSKDARGKTGCPSLRSLVSLNSTDEGPGYLVIEDALSPAELAAARRAADAAEAAWRADPSRPGTRIPEFLEIEGILEYDPLFLDVAVHPRIFPLVREILSPDIALIDHAYYITPPGGTLDGEAWHTDVRKRVPGVHHAGSTMMVRVMIALEDIPEDGGATLVLPGTHRQPDDTPIPRVAVPEDMPGAVALACKAGTAYFFNGNLVHSPGTNRGTTTRRVLLFNYGHKWMRMWAGHEPSERLAAAVSTPLCRQLLGLTPPYRGAEADPETPP